MGRLLAKTALAAVALAAAGVLAQEPAFMEAATHPGRGQAYGRLLLTWEDGDDLTVGSDVREARATVKLAYGLTARTALLVDATATRLERVDLDRQDAGLEEVALRLKQQILRHDFGPLNTWRTSLLAGIVLPGPDEDVAARHARGTAGLTSTAILGRHGLNGQLNWALDPGSHDRLEAHASYLFRLAPKEYAVDTAGAWYIMTESLNEIETDTDRRHLAALGLLYEARRWAAEAAVALPVHQQTDRRMDAAITIGWRYLF